MLRLSSLVPIALLTFAAAAQDMPAPKTYECFKAEDADQDRWQARRPRVGEGGMDNGLRRYRGGGEASAAVQDAGEDHVG